MWLTWRSNAKCVCETPDSCISAVAPAPCSLVRRCAAPPGYSSVLQAAARVRLQRRAAAAAAAASLRFLRRMPPGLLTLHCPHPIVCPASRSGRPTWPQRWHGSVDANSNPRMPPSCESTAAPATPPALARKGALCFVPAAFPPRDACSGSSGREGFGARVRCVRPSRAKPGCNQVVGDSKTG